MKFLMALLLTTALLAQAPDPPLPTDPHSVSHCDLPARAARSGGKPCACVRFVAEVQERWADRCWRDGGLPPPPAPLPTNMMPPDVRECIAASPGHCEVIAKGVFYWNSELGTDFPAPPAGVAYNACQTSCYPHKCGCQDGQCAKHEETEAY